jgi:hypothetical protein
MGSGEDIFDDCQLLCQDLLQHGNARNEAEIPYVLHKRFEGLPIHRICYYHLHDDDDDDDENNKTSTYWHFRNRNIR